MPARPPLPTALPHTLLGAATHAMDRRRWLLAALGAGGGAAGWLLPAGMARALAPRSLVFPRDHGSHPDLRTEWWYITGQALAGGRRWGFQVTFFRSRVDAAQGMRSAFAARQLVFAHAALTDVQGRRLHHDQRIARAGFGIAEAAEHDTDVRLRDWSLVRADGSAPGTSRYTARVQGAQFGLELTFVTTQPLLLQGSAGLSRKGPEPVQASHYYSQPQLAVAGHITLEGQRMAVDERSAPHDRRAWLDHEWSEALMHPDAVGWDWIGMNLEGGAALMAFRLRRADGSALWAGGSWRAAGETAPIVFGAGDVSFTPLRHWQSGVTGARYPVEWQVATPRGRFTVQAVLDDQELDSRGSTGAVYWEGLSRLVDASGSAVGQGYLEMTGYARRLELS
ncbi:lipocalin-like domain-containing protein [Acidovorax sp. FG27]